MKFGLNLFSLRKQIETPETFLETAFALKEMGYSYLQFSGAPFDKDVIRTVSEKTELPVVLTHVPLDRILNDTDTLVKEHDYFGCRNVGLGMMKFRDQTDEQILANIALLEEAGQKLQAKGAKFFYHHHAHEFCKLTTGQTIFDCILERTEHVNITLDTYWLQMGGVSILDYIQKAEGRLECVHLKDFLPTYDTADGKLAPAFAPVGSGNINWKQTIDALKAANATYFLVEQDNAALTEDPLGQVGSSIRYLNQHFGN
ncbi:MAG: sugar phosphate isomerase/epimerase [Clostridia bacterium]|nr:sugar phosphate isomerase/epimerase [Clostridia bacterium]